jgi:4-alpha-glucanotransferase
MVEGGALRMDHVMALQRMWWVPEGLQASDGAYVKNHLNDLMAIVALESQRCHCLVVGEDLGTVPPEIRQSMRDIGMYSYKVIVFELDETGHCRKPDDYPTRSVVTLTTHDMPPIAGVWSGSDIKARQRIGLLADGKPAENAINVRRTEKERLVAALQRERLLEVQDVHHDEVMNRLRPKMMDAIQMYAARSSASLMLVRAEEWLGEEEPFNLPGTDQEYPNWRRKLDIDLVSFLNDPKCMQWCAQITGTRNRNESASSQS